uniref:Putative secreted protein n=1 Tax=Amblyomma cajennense TaxID=34607 RepID=A0A023FG30_AMBCJ
MSSCVAIGMLSSMIILIGVIPAGLGRPQNYEDQGGALGCEELQTKIGREIYYRKCQCKGANLPPDTKCLKTEKRPDNEESGRQGKCVNGDCVLKNVTMGCKVVPEIPPGSSPPYGCAFYCDSANGVYGFFPVGTVCRHRKGPTEYVNGTCQNSGDAVICSENAPLPPTC